MTITLSWGEWNEIASEIADHTPVSVFVDMLTLIESVSDDLPDHTPVTLTLDVLALSHIYTHTKFRFSYGTGFSEREWRIVRES